jgi:hypothetical protein
VYDFDRVITDCRVIDLDHPDETMPNNDAIFGKAADVAQLRHNQAQNSAVAWSIRYFDLQTQPGKVEYPIDASEAFGKPVRIHTIDPNNKRHCTRKVPVIDPREVEEFYQGPAQSLVGGQNHHSAVAFQIYYKYGQPFLKPEPTPSDTSKYRVWFETGEIPEPALQDGLPVPDAFHRYLRISTSVAIISQCCWTRLLGDDPNAIDPERALRIMVGQRATLLGDPRTHGLLKQEADFKKEYEDWIATSSQGGTGEGNPYGEWAAGW